MKLKKAAYRLKPPCAKCPYTLGLIHTLVNPCPQCRETNYQAYERYQKMSQGSKRVT